MAILNSIRKRGVFLILIIALALFAFILSDVISSGNTGPKGQNHIASIDGINISRQDFMEEVEMMQRNIGPGGNTHQAMNFVWQRELRNAILLSQSKKVGIEAEKAQINHALKITLANNPVFLNEAGEVDDGKIQEYIASIKASSPEQYRQWIAFEDQIADGVIQETYINMIKGGLGSTIMEGEINYHFNNDKVNFKYLMIPYSSIEDDEITVSDSEIQQYIATRSKNFQVEAQADLQYVFFKEEPSQEDIDEVKDEITALLESRVVYNPETQTNDTIPGFAGIADYEDFVNANSDEAFFDAWLFRNNLPEDIAEDLMKLEKDEIYGPYKTGNYYNLSRVVGIKHMPDSVDSKHILIRYAGTMQASPDITRTESEARKLADSLLAVVKNDKSKFESLAKDFSDDGSKDSGGDLGTSTPGRLVPPFEEFIFSNPSGSLGVVQTDFGYHVVEVGKQSEPKKAIQLATITKEIEPSERTINELFTKASRFEVAVTTGDFNGEAEAENLEVRPVNKIGKMDATIPGIGDNRGMVTWAFDSKTKIGDIKRFSVSEGYVVAQLTRRNKEGLMPASEAAAKVKPILVNKKKAKKIREAVSGTSMDEIAKNQGVSIRTVSGITMATPNIGSATERKVVGRAFGTKTGETTPLLDGKEGVYMLEVTSFTPATKLDSYAGQMMQLEGREIPSAESKVFEALKKNAKIVDHRSNFY